MNLDTVLSSWSNVCGAYLQATGDSYLAFSNMLAFNPMLKPFSQDLEKYGRFMIEKGMPLKQPAWFSPNFVVYEGHKVALRKFNPGHLGNPILFVAPEAGHNSQITDYGPDQSLVQCALNRFQGDVYVVDKLPAGSDDTTYTIDDSILSLKACVEAIGEPIHLVGLCQGGWQSAIFTALFPEHVKSLTLAAAPIDFHAGDAVITRWARTLPFSFYKQMVMMGNGNMPGCFIVQGFMMMNPYDRFVGDNVDLATNVNDPAFIDRYRRFAQWYYYTQPVPGTMYLQIVESLFRENKLIKGELKILNQCVNLGNITQPLNLVAGQNDDITPIAQLFAAEQYVRSSVIDKAVVPAGHVGVFMGKQIIRDYWAHKFPTLRS